MKNYNYVKKKEETNNEPEVQSEHPKNDLAHASIDEQINQLAQIIIDNLIQQLYEKK